MVHWVCNCLSRFVDTLAQMLEISDWQGGCRLSGGQTSKPNGAERPDADIRTGPLRGSRISVNANPDLDSGPEGRPYLNTFKIESRG